MATSENFFQLFGFTPAFRVDLKSLSAKYRELQRAAHPDRFAGGTAGDQLLSVQYAATINQAYQILKNPLKRAIYLLEIKGIDINKEHSFKLGPDFLMQQIEYREHLESLADSANPQAELLELRQELTALQDRLHSAFERSYSQGSEEELNNAVEIVNKLQFVDKMLLELERKEDEWLGL